MSRRRAYEPGASDTVSSARENPLPYLLDTNNRIKSLTGSSPRVRSRLGSLSPADVVLCSIVKAELYYGAGRAQHPERTMGHIATCGAPFTFLAFDDSCAHSCGQVRSQLE
jgi:tRNA(fMet)-specific endonuclease VapC